MKKFLSNKYYQILTVFLILAGLFPQPAFAATVDLCQTTQGGISTNKLCAATLSTIIPSIINTALFIAFITALLFLIIGGVRWITSGGDKEATGKAKGTVTAALVGLAIVLGSWILINIVINFFGGTSGLNGLTIPTLL